MRGIVAYIVIVGGFGVAFCRESRISIVECLRRRIEINLARSLSGKKARKTFLRSEKQDSLPSTVYILSGSLYYIIT